MSDPTDRVSTPVENGLRMLSGRYLLQEKIASGGMASVWRARDEVLARTVAVKLLHDHLAADPDFRERFRREAISAAKLSHPFIVSIFDSGVDGDRVFLVMEFVEGVTLRDLVIDDGALPPGKAAAIGEKVARGLDYAHRRGLVHRDVKPANILINDRQDVAKIADFGIAKADQIDDLTKTGMVLGTAAYVAPEQIMAQPTDGKADQYSLGCVLYETLTGRQPFKAETAVATAAQRLDARVPSVRTLRPEVPPGLEQVVVRAMALRPEDRFPSCGHLADVLAAFTGGGSNHTATLAAPATIALPAQTRPGRSPRSARAPRRASDAEAGRFGRIAQRLVLPVLGLLVFAGGLFAALWSGALDTAPAEQEPATPAASPIVLDANDLAPFDPVPGDGQENAADLGALVDGAPDTVWDTEGYETADFGRLKDGVGFVLDLGQVTTVEAVVLTVQTEGIGLELYAADTLPTTIEAMGASVAQVGGARTPAELRPAEPVQTQYLVVWITGPLFDTGEGSNPFRAEIAEVQVLGATATAAPAG